MFARGRPTMLEQCPVERVSSRINSKLNLYYRNPWVKVPETVLPKLDSWLGNAKEDLKMRKTLIAMLGLVALGLWALPASAVISGPDPKKDLPMVTNPIPVENRGDLSKFSGRLVNGYLRGAPRATLSGTLVNQSTALQAVTQYFLYPGACTDVANGDWGITPPLAFDSTDTYPNHMRSDSLNIDIAHPEYVVGTRGPYTASDQSLADILFHVNEPGGSDDNQRAPAGGGAIFSGSTRHIWCGLNDTNWTLQYGYPNLTYQILYVDTRLGGTARGTGTYTLTFKHNWSSEHSYDYNYLIGGTGAGVDPIGQSRVKLDAIINAATGSTADGHLLLSTTGSVVAPFSGSTTGGPIVVLGSGSAEPTTTTSTLTIASSATENRALYFVFHSDCLWSNEDALWFQGTGTNIDEISVSDTGALYTDEASVNVADSTLPPGAGMVIKGTAGVPFISARVGPGQGQLWQLKAGSTLPTPDTCNPKNTSSDLMFLGTNSSGFAVDGQYNSVVTCEFPIPTGTASVIAAWDAYFDLPSIEGYVQQSEYRIFKDGAWTGWDPTNADRTVSTGSLKSWLFDFDEIGAATQAEKIQIRYNMQCIPPFALNGVNCGIGVQYGVMYDNLRLEVTTGVPAPIFGIFDGALAQSTFVDGTIDGTFGDPPQASCTPGQVTAGQCWPGIRGSDDTNTALLAVHDNFNTPYGDSMTFSLVTGLAQKGLGINWKHGFENVGNRLTLWPLENPNYNASFDVPRIIYQIYDPATTTWSPWDSSELDANAVTVSVPGGGVPQENVNSAYRVNWPPRDKAGTPYAGSPGWTLNGEANYPAAHPSGSGGDGPFLPRGTRVRYYFKAVDIDGGTSLQFSGTARGREVFDADDPCLLPGGSDPCPDIIEFDVLPRVYPTGTAGTLVAGRKNAVILDLDGMYTRWGYSTHHTVQSLRSMGVRFDRYRMLQGLNSGAHIGGHELLGRRPGRQSNYFPNREEWALKDSLATWYKIVIQSTGTFTQTVDESQDVLTLKDWWLAETKDETGADAADQGDRCIFSNGDNTFNLFHHGAGTPANQADLQDFALTVYGVKSPVPNETNVTVPGSGSTVYPNVRDMFADPAAGPGLGTSGNYQYVLDGGCPAPNRFDELDPVSGVGAVVSATYNNIAASPTRTGGAAIARMAELDLSGDDHDRNKALAYGFSLQYVRQGSEMMVDARTQILYKFLASCRGPRTVTDTASCWPCPTNADKYTNWATSGGFSTSTYGPLYPIQDGTRVLTGVNDPTAGAPPAMNRMKGNFPNPFNPETAIRFTSAGSGRVEVRIYDVAGRLVQSLSKSNVVAGTVNEVRWNGKSKEGADLASGIYFVKLRYPDGTEDRLGHKVAIVR